MTVSFVEVSEVHSTNSNLVSVSQILLESTQKNHRRVSDHRFVTLIQEAKIEPKQYHQYLTDLLWIYTALEDGIRDNQKQCVRLKCIYFEDLFRVESIKKDLASLRFKDFSSQPSVAAVAYAGHLKHLVDYNPLGLIAHALIRYLGDTSGGMIIKNYIKNLWGEESLKLYDFSNLLKNLPIENIGRFNKFFKESIDETFCTDHEVEVLKKESIIAYDYSESIFNAAIAR